MKMCADAEKEEEKRMQGRGRTIKAEEAVSETIEKVSPSEMYRRWLARNQKWSEGRYHWHAT